MVWLLLWFQTLQTMWPEPDNKIKAQAKVLIVFLPNASWFFMRTSAFRKVTYTSLSYWKLSLMYPNGIIYITRIRGVIIDPSKKKVLYCVKHQKLNTQQSLWILPRMPHISIPPSLADHECPWDTILVFEVIFWVVLFLRIDIHNFITYCK